MSYQATEMVDGAGCWLVSVKSVEGLTSGVSKAMDEDASWKCLKREGFCFGGV